MSPGGRPCAGALPQVLRPGFRYWERTGGDLLPPADGSEAATPGGHRLTDTRGS